MLLNFGYKIIFVVDKINYIIPINITAVVNNGEKDIYKYCRRLLSTFCHIFPTL